ncbi:amidohydrolase [Cyclonatronum proteinivorum]|uniref:Amidohydrolase n=1 Tax=Cyclonatronum proteinivorum TaxID=1457365 RepID=A0A345UID0_9BACT|nr:amidohydrolase [Cyclonatronum proteinivorum]AXJ00232.1 amidohydrolase [Cyclonatronum proteinivorum]
MIQAIEAYTEEHLPRWIQMRRKLHQLAEVSGEEAQTAAQLEKWLRQTGPAALHTNLGGQGIIAVYGPQDAPKQIMLRAELDALPIADPPEWEHRAHNPAAGHKCGHDGHMMFLIALAEYFGENPPEDFSIMLLFQQAEETGDGAAQMIATETFAALKPDVIIALHNLPGYARHAVVLRSGVFASASTGLRIKLKGATSHAAHPDDGISPAPALSQLMQLLPAIPGQRAPLQQMGLVTVVHARLGEQAFGTAPGEAELMATFRAPETHTVQAMLGTACKLAKGLAVTYGLAVDFEYKEVFEASVNNPELCQRTAKIAENLGLEVHWREAPFMWSEDFGRFSRYGTTILFGLGAGLEHPQLHSEGYDFPDELLPTGLRVYAGLINDLVHNPRA